MMRFVCSRYVAAAAALAYLLTGALSTLHHHEHGRHGLAFDEPGCHERATHQSEGNDYRGEVAECRGEGAERYSEHDSAPLTDDNCLACRLATQSAVVCLPPPDSCLCSLIVELRSPRPAFFVEPVHSCGLARAPPLA